jgi:hypothetical protein
MAKAVSVAHFHQLRLLNTMGWQGAAHGTNTIILVQWSGGLASTCAMPLPRLSPHSRGATPGGRPPQNKVTFVGLNLLRLHAT